MFTSHTISNRRQITVIKGRVLRIAVIEGFGTKAEYGKLIGRVKKLSTRNRAQKRLNCPIGASMQSGTGSSLETRQRCNGLQASYDDLMSRALADGSFSTGRGRRGRPDVTAWAVLALKAVRVGDALLEPARRYLCSVQSADGRIPVCRDNPEAYWPTAPAILAWLGSPGAEPCLERAVEFLLTHTGVHWDRRPEDFVKHDTALKGWPWIGGSHSWVEPTALGVLALRLTGNHQHPRVEEAVRMIMDRQIPGGGWNYGNTFVFGQRLRPMPESTGLALATLQGLVARAEVAESIDYLKPRIPLTRTPHALSWGLLGLGAWGETPPSTDGLIVSALKRQEEVGVYDTEGLSLLLLASRAGRGLVAFLQSQMAESRS